ncbi:MBG domain-containing protein, partial [Oleisolibacter albus]|uniref:MBG domain-containing protein n=1 Tax=Oleisolibacter albus TaxID=2171757 RepID=UPI0023D8E321
SYSIVGSAATGSGLSNYSITYVDGTLTVNPAALTISVGNASKTYGASASLSGYSASGLVNGDSISGLSLVSSGSGTAAGVGSYSIVGSAATGSGLSNYSITYVDGTLTVNPAALTITAGDLSKMAGTNVVLTAYSAFGLVNGDTVSGVVLSSLGVTAGAAPGTYAIVARDATGTGLGNYIIRYQDGTLTVTAAPTLTTAAVQRIVVTAAVPPVTAAPPAAPTGGGTAPVGTGATSSGGGTASGGAPADAGGGGTTTVDTASAATGEGKGVSGDALPILVSGTDNTVYSQIQMTTDPIKGTQNDERQQ